MHHALFLVLLLLFSRCTTNNGSGGITTVTVQGCSGGVLLFGEYAINTSFETTLTLANVGPSMANGVTIKGLHSPFDYKGGAFPGTGGTCKRVLEVGESCTVVLTASLVAGGLNADPIGVLYSTGNTISASGCVLTAFVYGTAGTLDTAFGTQGIGFAAVTSSTDLASYGLFSGDGTVTVIGSAVPNSNYDIAVARYSSNGELDTRFATSGKLTLTIGNANDYGVKALYFNDGAFYIAGYTQNGSNNDFHVIRLLSNGNLDSTFGTDGKKRVALLSGHSFLTDAILDLNGSIILGGHVENGANYDLELVRLLSTGDLDTTFNSSGKKVLAIGVSNDYAGTLARQPNGNTLVTGWHTVGGKFLGFITRLTSEGSLDTTFNSTGKFITSFGSQNNWLKDIVYSSDGTILAGGYFTATGGGTDLALVRVTSDGVLDTSFHSTGKTTLSLHSGSETLASLVIETNGKILAGGTFPGVGSEGEFFVLRFLSDGSTDSAFGTGGFTVTDASQIHQDDSVSRILFQPFQVVVIGSSINGANYDFAVAKYWR